MGQMTCKRVQIIWISISLSFDRSDSISITSKTGDRGLVTQWVQSKVADVRSEVAEIKVADVRAKVADVWTKAADVSSNHKAALEWSKLMRFNLNDKEFLSAAETLLITHKWWVISKGRKQPMYRFWANMTNYSYLKIESGRCINLRIRVKE